MFKQNESYRQLEVFSISTKLNKNQQKLWDKSKEHLFFTEVFCDIDESLFSILYSNKKSRPNTPVNQLVGALILKHLYNWTYQELFTNLNFNLLTRHALGINSIHESVFCEASIFNFQNKLLDHLSTSSEDLMEKVFSKLTAQQIEQLDVDTSVQRGDSFLVGSNIVDYTRVRLLIEVLIRLTRILEEKEIELYQEQLSIYTKYTASNYIYHLKKEDLPNELEQLGSLYANLYFSLGDKYIDKKEYVNFKRVYGEHFRIKEDKNILIIPSKELNSSILMSPDDTQATYRDKNKNTCKGYVTHISETVNPDNKINLITDVVTEANNIGDAEILENRLGLMLERTPAIKEYFVDGQYGSPGIDKITKVAGITIYQKTTRGRKSKAGIKIEQNDLSEIRVSCKGGQSVLASPTTHKRLRGIFDPKKCLKCPFSSECNVRESGGKTKIKRRVIYFSYAKIDVHKRLSNIGKLEGRKKFSRANVEATVKEMKRGMKNGKVRIREWSRVSMHMVLTALAINFTRIHKNITQNVLITVHKLHNSREFKPINSFFCI